jgi:DNA-binding CsgD family transcriptional regulator
MENAWIFTYNNIEKVKQICAPLERFGLNFCYEKIFKDGTFFILINHYSTFYHTFRDHKFFDFDQQANKFYMSEVFSTLENHQKSLLWPIELYRDPVKKLMYSYGVGGGLSFFHNNMDAIETWNFISNKPPQEADAFLRAHSKILEQFIHYFNHHTKDLKDYHHHKLILPKLHEELIMWEDFHPTKDQTVLEFLQEIQISQYQCVGSDSKDITLTKREIECLYHLSLGKTIQEIALAADISPATVTYHVNNIKSKGKLNSRSQLVQMFMRNRDLLNVAFNR